LRIALRRQLNLRIFLNMFKLIKKSKIRQGILKTRHGEVKTPFFMPDATRAVVKMIGSQEVGQLGVEAMVVNTLHLYLQPGMKVIKKSKGVHNFMGFEGPLLSDSGGFQVFSLAHKRNMGKIDDKQVVFKSPIDGSRHVLTPEKSIQIQFDLGADMMVVLDDCPPNEFDRKSIEKSVERTINWARRCRVEYDKQIKKRNIKDKDRPLIFGVIQGGVELDLRKKCAGELIKLNFDGYGFGARPVDEQGKFLDKVLEYTAALIPEDKLRFALGIGTPEDIKRCVKMGWDMFDCVVPTREARHGRLYVDKGKGYKVINISNAQYRESNKAIDTKCGCELCKNYSASYLHHLFKIKEPLSQRLATIHNLYFYCGWMKKIV